MMFGRSEGVVELLWGHGWGFSRMGYGASSFGQDSEVGSMRWRRVPVRIYARKERLHMFPLGIIIPLYVSALLLFVHLGGRNIYAR